MKDHYLIRLRQRLSKKQLKDINKQFKDMLSGGTFRLMKDLRHDNEKDRALERLIFRFDRMSFYRLRELIDLVNTY